MIVTIKSQCGKKALIETRRVLDQFFERAGDRTWEGPVTLEGLQTVRMLLRKTARRNTAVACHRVRGTQQLELEWIVGNARRFNAQGRVPTNSTERDVLKSDSENQWHTAEVIALLAGIAGLFHDFGKANALFQLKLRGQRGMQEPLRHEWLSLLMFVAFVRGKCDQQWLAALASVQTADDQRCLDQLAEFRKNREAALKNPFVQLEGKPLAQTIGWLILSHHRLPVYPTREASKADEIEDESSRIPKLELTGITLDHRDWFAPWNSSQCLRNDWTADEWEQLFTFARGTPIASQRWCDKARQLAQRALKLPALIDAEHHWLLQDHFSSHLARLSLMLADHSYSAADKQTKWWDDSYQVYANTDKRDGNGKRPLKQRLDEHNIGVGQNALLLARQLPNLRSSLPVLVSHKTLKARSKKPAYRWQDKAFDVAVGLSVASARQGFFGVNMASTGKGKTFANARIMYGLASEQQGCRFSVALGLRTLTLQTGDALKERLKLDSDELAVLVGSQAVQELHRRRSESDKPTDAQQSGSESSSDLLDDTQHVSYDGTLNDGPLRRWLGQSPDGKPSKVLQLLSAPVLVSTIDHLMPSTEGVRGGKQIAPMLRLLTSDLVLDEPDDFDSTDLPALCRLVNWAGMLGSRVLLSSASMPPAMLTALFSAYRAGWEQFDKACGSPGQVTQICCAWFDEFDSSSAQCLDQQAFKTANAGFVEQRVKHLQADLQPGKALRCAEVLDVATAADKNGIIAAIAESCWQGMQRLHQQHAETDPKTGKRVSLGLIRMANINPLTAVAKHLIEGDVPADVRLHLCVYHSQHPLLVRSQIEARLDSTLSRHEPEKLWEQPEIRTALDTYPEQNHLFVVLGSPVTEVGRDHDYDWAIAEPSSMRSLIQLAGRIQRHRKQPPATVNMLVLNYNYRALKQLVDHRSESGLVFTQPGFEARAAGQANRLCLDADHRAIRRCVDQQDLQAVSSIPRIVQPARAEDGTSLVQIEHLHLIASLFENKAVQIAGRTPADRWWQLSPSPGWHAEMQRRTPFRKSSADDAYVLFQEDETAEPEFHRIRESDGLLLPSHSTFDYPELNANKRCSAWIETDVKQLIAQLAEDMGREVSGISKQFCEIRLRRLNDSGAEVWQYHPWLGVFREIQ
ncbi:type I-F CRISPR-associated helicase Cas3f [Parathalassolituus penaei]|uniref:Type I-F CRISPR-associated helicase Cas3f n=1 Tax=Parathalassolituus penaei TaxID=2997323 RepID=A0A9X3IST8_9GAMM|nr:type I-F CRISPR-associated helicase Cas3f [Parathalassolituus penaei]MCY0964508.1 type I-F CRISPR-associated helicase Cas3f [Parathalassolituus penaei]